MFVQCQEKVYHVMIENHPEPQNSKVDGLALSFQPSNYVQNNFHPLIVQELSRPMWVSILKTATLDSAHFIGTPFDNSVLRRRRLSGYRLQKKSRCKIAENSMDVLHHHPKSRRYSESELYEQSLLGQHCKLVSSNKLPIRGTLSTQRRSIRCLSSMT